MEDKTGVGEDSRVETWVEAKAGPGGTNEKIGVGGELLETGGPRDKSEGGRGDNGEEISEVGGEWHIRGRFLGMTGEPSKTEERGTMHFEHFQVFV